ncbi:hypothetical protein [Streptomyces sp. WMMC897]|nr:hypothetical protein [Streptomyces sp. WMMC897]MCZ7414669.1 hypothetical protein [Streptomyces sp. WMMC897]
MVITRTPRTRREPGVSDAPLAGVARMTVAAISDPDGTLDALLAPEEAAA